MGEFYPSRIPPESPFGSLRAALGGIVIPPEQLPPIPTTLETEQPAQQQGEI